MKAKVIIADPPWQYRVGGCNGAVETQYATMVFAEIATIPVSEWAADDCVLACWGTWPKLDEGIDLVRSWGFQYVTGFPWIKTMRSGGIKPGIGFWTQSISEVVLIGRKGNPKRDGESYPVMGLLEGGDRQFWCPNPKSHSEKPYGLHAYLEARFAGPYLELFARRPHPGWTCWGGDLGFVLSEKGCQGSVPLPQSEQRELFG